MNIINLVQFLDDVYDCAALGITSIPGRIASLVSLIYHLILVGVPLLLILFGMLDLGKAVIASKEDEIKKGQKTFISRIIAAVIVFFVFAVVKLVVSLASEKSDGGNITTCLDAIINYNTNKGTTGKDQVDG